MNFTSYSQAGQSAFVHALLPKTDGTYIDIGACHPVEINNTYGLEQLGWRGVSVDIDANAVALHENVRKNVAWVADATRIEWDARLSQVVPTIGPKVDYLSLDIDESSLAALNNLLRYDLRFHVITAEHDAYRNEDRLRKPMRDVLHERGYWLVASDVCADDGSPYEDWWVSREIATSAVPFKSHNMKWRDILRQGGIET